ncbi:N-acetyl sugar amidotransferase [Candidatus Pelagibacter sp.]|jgi:N-acetyl sugar amidotransferase|nr:N-acetyl sugar amidotransferase [Candidatus Pelagibacter sp.]
MKYCSNCLYPSIAVNLKINDKLVCSSCSSRIKFKKLSKSYWEKRKKIFQKILDETRKNNKSNYDCVIPVSGGKDSYYQTHVITKIFNLKPLLVTYDGNNWLPEGELNRNNLKHNFNADHIMWSPSVDVLKKLNRIGFKKMGDMNWQNHCGIYTAPVITAVKFKIPLIIWGETTWDISGMYDPEDFVEFSARDRHEHSLRGFEWSDFLNDKKDKLNPKDLIWAKYPSDQEILSLGIRGLFVGNFFPWDGKKNAELAIKKYSFQVKKTPFERTYRNFSNLDDRYENGVHDLMKFIKFGYGRCSDHASKDIRNHYITKKKGIELIKKYDHVVSKDLYHWLDYVGMKEKEFWQIADTFRDPRVWWIKNKKWYKDNIWGKPSSYGDVYLNKKQISDFNKRQQKLFK